MGLGARQPGYDTASGLDSLEYLQVAAGVGHTMFLVDADSEVVKKLGAFEPEVETEPSKNEEEVIAEANGAGESSQVQG